MCYLRGLGANLAGRPVEPGAGHIASLEDRQDARTMLLGLGIDVAIGLRLR
jgi:hypothetical protein